MCLHNLPPERMLARGATVSGKLGDWGPHLDSAINSKASHCPLLGLSLPICQDAHVEARLDDPSLGFLLVIRSKIPLPGYLLGEMLRNI